MATSKDIRDLLAEIVRTQAARGPLPSSAQSNLIGNSLLNPPVAPFATDAQSGDPRGPSVVSRILDVVSRPLYGTANVVKGTVESMADRIQQDQPTTVGDTFGSMFQGAVEIPPAPIFQMDKFWRGISGQDKTTGRDILEATGDAPTGVEGALSGFALDVGLDPLTYVGAGPLRSLLGRSAQKSTQALRGAEEASGDAAQALARDISQRAASASEISRIPSAPGTAAPAPGSPPRTFMAGPGAGPLNMPLPTPAAIGRTPEGFVPLDIGAIAGIKNAIRAGRTLDEAAPRPLLPGEKSVLEHGIRTGQSARRLEAELTRATGAEVPKPFGKIPPRGPLSDDIQRQIDQLEEQRNQLNSRIEDLEMQTSGTTSTEALQAEMRRLEDTLTTVERGPAREQILQRMDAIQEELLASSTIGPAGVTRTIINQEINALEGQSRQLGQQIESLRRTPQVVQEQTTPTQASLSPGESIATPVAKPPETVSDLLQEVTGVGQNWRRLMQKQIDSIPADADRMTTIRWLEAQKLATRSPVYKNMINAQIKKLQEGVTPANLIDAARINQPEFPRITLSSTRKNAARDIAESFLRTNKFDEINLVGQTNLMNRIRNWVAKQGGIPANAKPNVIYQMLRVAEDSILAGGRNLVDAEGFAVRLSDVANIAGGGRVLTNKFVDDFRNARPIQAVENVKALNEPAIAQQIVDPIMQAGRRITEEILRQQLPPSRTVQLGSQITNELANIARAAGASSREAAASKRFLSDLFNPQKDDLYNEIMQEARQLVRQSATGKVDAHLINRINAKIYRALDANPKVLGKQIPQNRVVEAIMTRFATWWNAKDIKPFAREYIDTARNIAAAFQKALTPLVRATTPKQRTQAWRVTQGRVAAGNEVEQELSNRFLYLMEKLVGSADVTNTRAVAESVLHRAGLTISDLNKELPARFKFIDTKSADSLGREFNYRDGKWMNSWKEWDVDDPAEALYQVTRAIQTATKKNAMLDDAAARWGVPVRGGEFTTQVNAERLRGFYFPKPIAEQLQTVWNRIESDKFYHGGQALQLFDKVQRMWKTGVTIYSPSHHIRNLNGDIFLNMLDGVVGVRPYRVATQVMHAYAGRYKDIENVFNIMDQDLRELALRADPGKVILTTRAGHRLTAEQIYTAAESRGFLLRATTLEDLVETGGETAQGMFGAKFAPFGGRVHQTAASASELRDHWVRIAHFADVLGKSKTKNLSDAIDEAARRVRKFHPDGSDLTGFEQSVMRRLLPFYSWLRKATPLVIEGMVMRPHVTLAYPKIMSNLQTMTGVEANGPADPFPMDQMFPDWIKEKGIGPIFGPEHPLAGIGRQETWRGEAPGYTIVNPSNPFQDQMMQLGNPRQTLVSSLTPAARIPIELLTGQNALGIPLSEVEGGTAGHLAQQVPAVGIGMRISGQTRPDEPYQPEQLINWLTALGVTGTGPYQSQAQFEIRDILNRMGQQNREEMR